MKRKTRIAVAVILVLVSLLTLLPIVPVEAAGDVGLTGKGVTVAVIDTGLNPDPAKGPKHVAEGRHFYWREEPGGRYLVADKYCNYYSNNDTSDSHGHGTRVARVITALAPEATIMPVRIVHDNSVDIGGGHSSKLVSAINYAVENGADVINMSISGYVRTAELQEAIDNANAAGCIVIAGAGNDGNAALKYPAACQNVIGVGATDWYGYLASYSQRNRSVDVCAPGYVGENGSTGTSFSAAFVSGTVAALKEAYPDMTTEDLMAILPDGCDPVPLREGDKQAYTGAGVIKAAKMLWAARRRMEGKEDANHADDP